MLEIMQDMKEALDELVADFYELKQKLNSYNTTSHEVPDNQLPTHLQERRP